ncbi:MAG: M20/M25/M40 family metallo-hydrolase [Thermoplasmata archaeon]|nr:M20/M25/M40 family metallo-hydrolase [Thermoplasmata archaeon]
MIVEVMPALTEEKSATSLDFAKKMMTDLVLARSSNLDDKTQIINIVKEFLEELAFKCRMINSSDSPALIATKDETGLLLSGHLDTVPIGDGWSHAQGEIQGTAFYGRGAADMKGGCTAMLMTAIELTDKEMPLSLAFTTDEETTMRGAEAIASDPIIRNADAIIICEPTDLDIGVREKGLIQIGLSTTGKSSHAAMPQEGKNAIHSMLFVIDQFKDLMMTKGDPMDSMTLNVDVIRGGNKVNVLPDRCEAELDVRTPATMSPEEALRLIRDRTKGLEFDLRIINKLDPIIVSEESKIVKAVMSIRREAALSSIAYASEMIMYIRQNANVIALGPGDPRQAHVPDEHIDLNEIVEACRLYSTLCQKMRERPF